MVLEMDYPDYGKRRPLYHLPSDLGIIRDGVLLFQELESSCVHA